jgi:gliding-associated putative ABC transporter substrate-binding component GldG
MKSKKSLLLYILAIIGFIVLLNFLANRFFLRLDLTKGKQYTLSQATKDILRNLDGTITITAYFSEDLPPDIAKTRQDFKNLLTEYSTRSHGNIVYEFINPNKNETTEQDAIKNGISPVVINVREKDQSVQKKAFLGAVLKYSGKTNVIPFLQPGSAMEYSLTSGIKKLVVKDKPFIGFIQGHGEPTTSDFPQAMQSLDILYQSEGVNLTDSTYLSKYKTLVLFAPTDSIPPQHLAMLDNYLAGGGNLVVGINAVNGDLGKAMGVDVKTGLEVWLRQKGITVDNSFVIDASCGTVGVRQQQGAFTFTSQLSFPYLPLVSSFAPHQVTKGIEQVLFQFVSPITFSGNSSLHFIPLVYSSSKSGTQKAPLYFDVQKKWARNDFTMSGLTLAALVEGKFGGNAKGRMIIFGDGDFPVNGSSNSARQLQPDNVNLFVNSIDWLSDDTGLMDLRNKEVTSQPLAQIENGRKNFLKWMNFLLPIVLIIGYGVFRMDRSRRIRDRRRDEGYNK